MRGAVVNRRRVIPATRGSRQFAIAPSNTLESRVSR